ncbi:antibiotic biosynthesis monooxygenase [Thioalkalivibrio sp. XN279]|uniref:antibiotic biosynthesis monooxygenase family protein n=1 Tax=Thioalkalivibrio sp. XN279 TaxID=2714953 RepID=UPI001409A3D0|nr:antibiotic biosynthesis monooxygenase [Thioalkalivibrio sp. XN279]NHA15199.1 hypothetical protein [Thioalkalivibrio sp. XN279]
MKSLPVHQGAFNVLLVFDCKPGESEQFANELGDFVAQRMRFHPGFISGLVYLSEDARKVVEVFQWARAEDWQAYRRSEDGQEGLRWLAARTPTTDFLELVRCVDAPAPGDYAGSPYTIEE